MKVRGPHLFLATNSPRSSRVRSDSADPDVAVFESADTGLDSTDARTRTLSPVSHSVMNSLRGSKAPSSPSPKTNGTIRTVTAEDSEPRRTTTAAAAAMPHSTHSNSPIPSPSHNRNSTPARPNVSAAAASTRTTLPPLDFSMSPTSIRHVHHVTPPSIFSQFTASNTANAANGNGAVVNGQGSPDGGRGSQGKSGRVIERLMAENDRLKRDLNLERLRVDEANQAVRMAEGRMEQVTGEVDAKLHDASVNKTLLKRLERKMEEMKNHINEERARADAAAASERNWRTALAHEKEDSERRVREANTQRGLAEEQYRVLTSHWDEQHERLNKAVHQHQDHVAEVVEGSRKVDENAIVLQKLCEQQEQMLLNLQKEKDGIAAQFEIYRAEKENSLKDFKDKMQQAEEQNERLTREMKSTLGELKWALGVKQNVRGT